MVGNSYIMRWTPELPLKYLPRKIKSFYTTEADVLLSELKTFHNVRVDLPQLSPSGNRIDGMEHGMDEKNPGWYRGLCALHPKPWSKRSHKESCTNFHRQGTVRALERLLSVTDQEFFEYGTHNTRYRYDELLRKLIHIRLLCGSYSEGLDEWRGYNTPEEEVREFFGNPAIVKPVFVPQGKLHVEPLDMEETLHRLGVPTKDEYYRHQIVDLLYRVRTPSRPITTPLVEVSTQPLLPTGTDDEIPF